MIRMDPNADLLIEWNIRLRSNRCGEAPVRGKKCRMRIPEKATTRCPAHGDHVIRSMTTRAAHELDGAVGCVF